MALLSAGLRALRQRALPLYRAAAFQSDLELFLGPEWRADLRAHCSALPQVEAYCAHLAALAAARPLLLAAHSFTQHLAVASGGQIVARMVRRGLGLQGPQGTAAFDYGGEQRALKDAFKHEFNALAAVLSEEEVQLVSCRVCSDATHLLLSRPNVPNPSAGTLRRGYVLSRTLHAAHPALARPASACS